MKQPEALAEGFAAQVRRWALMQGAAPDLAALAAIAAQQLSLATSEGHVCVDSALLVDGNRDRLGTSVWRAALLGCGVAETAGPAGADAGSGATPMVIDDDGRLYLRRHFDLECRLAARLLRAARLPPQTISAPVVAQLADLFEPHSGAAAGFDGFDGQKLAAALALRQHLVVISGGPGTGKTTTVVQLLACLLVQDRQCRIRLAAPTGKAAARMHEALREQAVRLPPELRAALPTEAFTVHRLLLGAGPGGQGLHDAGRRLPLDVLVVDEASMLDLALATRLFEAVPDGARIILLGDQNQLSAVESGAVFAELSADPTLSARCIADLAEACAMAPERIVTPTPQTASPSPLVDSAVWLQRNFRFSADSGIGRVVAAAQRGDVQDLQQCLREGRDDLHWIDEAGPADPGEEAALLAMRQGFAPYLAALQRDPHDHAGAIAAFARFRVLCALREGPRGVQAVNQRLLQSLLPPTDPRALSVFGRPVMVLRNDALLGLFNGDIGLLLPGADGTLGAVFPAADGSGTRWLPTLQLPEHETAFALTVHKAQGSEFDEVLLLLPRQGSRVLSRELLYTALSRARRHITVVAPAAVLGAAAAAPTRRLSGLQARLREAAASTIDGAQNAI